MPSSVTFTSSKGEDPQTVLASIVDSWRPTEEQMLYAAAKQITRIRTRTAAGRDVNGAAFPDYSPAYAKRRAKAGRNATVDLTFSGKGLAAMAAEVHSADSFAIAYQDDEIATYMQAQNDGNERLPARRFFDTSPEELNEMAVDLRSDSLT